MCCVVRGCQASQSLALSSGKVRLLLGMSGELPGKSGELLANLWIALQPTVGEVLGKSSGNFFRSWSQGVPKSSKSDSLPATRLIVCNQRGPAVQKELSVRKFGALRPPPCTSGESEMSGSLVKSPCLLTLRHFRVGLRESLLSHFWVTGFCRVRSTPTSEW